MFEFSDFNLTRCPEFAKGESAAGSFALRDGYVNFPGFAPRREQTYATPPAVIRPPASKPGSFAATGKGHSAPGPTGWLPHLARAPTGSRVRAMSLPVLLAAYAGGLLLAPWLFAAPWSPLIPIVAGGLWLACSRQRLAFLLLLLFFFSLGLANYQLQLQPPADAGHIAAWTGTQPLRVEGRVVAVRTRPEGRSLVDLETRALTADGLRRPVRGRLRIFLGSPPGRIAPGDDLRLRAELHTPRDFGTPGEFDYRRHLAREGIFATTYLASSEDLALLPAAHTGIARDHPALAAGRRPFHRPAAAPRAGRPRPGPVDR